MNRYLKTIYKEALIRKRPMKIERSTVNPNVFKVLIHIGQGKGYWIGIYLGPELKDQGKLGDDFDGRVR